MALTGKTNEEKIWNFLKAQGFNDYGTAGLMGNLYAESGLQSINLQNTYEKSLGFSDESYTNAVDNGSYTNFVHDSAGYGLAQWTYYSRKQNLLDYAKSVGKSIGDLEMQLQFLVKELSGYSGMTQNLKNAVSLLEASNWVLLNFERPLDQSTSVQNKRASFGQVYYDKFAGRSTTVTTEKGDTMSAVERLIATAKAEIGYLEKATNSQLDDKTANAGSNNYTKYARDLDNLGNIYNGKKNGYAWCDMFVDWCFVKTFGVELAMKLLCQAYNGAGAGCTYSAQYYKNKGQFYKSNPKPGDQIFFTNDGGASSCHTGLVVAVDSSRVYTIEGNTSSTAGVVANGGCVRDKSYSLSYANIYGYGRPDYSLAGDTVLNTSPATTTDPTLKLGSTGSYVKALQEALIKLSYDVGSAGADGDFGNATLEAVKLFQKNNKLTVDGVVGTQTWTALRNNPVANDKAVNYQGKVKANGGLNCRTEPVNGSVITTYPNGTLVTITKERNGWGYTGTGWVSLDYVVKVQETVTVQPQTQKEDDDMLSFDDWKKYMEQYRKELQDNDAGSWSEAARQWAISNGLISGMGTGADGKPNYAWADQLTREQAAALFYRFAQYMGKV